MQENPTLPSSGDEHCRDPEHAEETVNSSARHMPPIIPRDTPTQKLASYGVVFGNTDDYYTVMLMGSSASTKDGEFCPKASLFLESQPLADDVLLTLFRGIMEPGGSITFYSQSMADRSALFRRCSQLLGSNPAGQDDPATTSD